MEPGSVMSLVIWRTLSLEKYVIFIQALKQVSAGHLENSFYLVEVCHLFLIMNLFALYYFIDKTHELITKELLQHNRKRTF